MAPGRIPGSSGTRNLHDNLSDLRAQVAANQKGIHLVTELIGQYGLEVVQAYMAHIQVRRRDLLQPSPIWAPGRCPFGTAPLPPLTPSAAIPPRCSERRSSEAPGSYRLAPDSSLGDL